MIFFKIKNYFLFFIFLIMSAASLLALAKGFYIYVLFVVVILGVGIYVLCWNFILKSVGEDRFVINFAFINKHFLFKEIKEVKCLDMRKVFYTGGTDQFSILTLKNKKYAAFYSVSSGDFEKIQEGVAKAQLQMGSSNTPE